MSPTEQTEKNEFIFLSDIIPSSEPDPVDCMIGREEISLMKREIARLSDIRRKIVIMRYFEEKPLNVIAERIGVPVGTIKWHLNGSRGEIRKGMDIMRTNGNLSMNPIRFKSISYSGSEGDDGSPQKLLSASIRQNILYAAYYKPQSVNEIADEMGVSPPYIREEIEFLMDFNYINEVEPGKYQSNIIILRDEDGAIIYDKLIDRIEDTVTKISGQLTEAYVKAEPDILSSGVYVPFNDAGFLRWTAFIQSVIESLSFMRFDKSTLPPHKDGHYLTITNLDSDTVVYDQSLREEQTQYYINGPMINWQVIKYGMWRVDHNWTKREPLRGFGRRDIGLAGAFRDGTLPFTAENAEAYQYLLDNGLAVKDGGGYALNVIFADTSEIYKRYRDSLPDLREILKPQIRVISSAVEEFLLKDHPRHIESQLRMAAHIMSIYAIGTLVLRNAADTGFLPKLTENTEKSASILIGEFGVAFA